MSNPKLKKRLFGQFYTPTSIVKLIANLAIKDSGDRVLDPAAGYGVFVEGAYTRLKELGTSHNNAVKQILAVEIDPDSYTKAKERLAKGSPKIINASFFEVSLGKFDAVVGNPPYVEQREIGESKRAIRKVALNFNGKFVKMNGRAGIYAYFVTQSAKLLKRDGRLCFIVSSSWLDSVWGRDLQNFILDNFVVRSVVAFGRDVFSDALVEAVVLLLRKKSNDTEEDLAKFVLLKKELGIDEIIGFVEHLDSYENDRVRIIAKSQADLRRTNHWSQIFRESALYHKIADNRMLVPLQDIADVDYNFKEGAYDFFILDEERMKRWMIEERYVKPIISSPVGIETFDLKSEDIKERILLVDEPKNGLKGTRALAYIEHGEREKLKIKRGIMRGKEVTGYNNLPTFRSKKVWYSFKTNEPCPILVPAFVRDRFFAIKNDAEAYATANFYGIRPFDKDHTTPILAYLNSSLASLLVELKARTSMGRGLLDIRAYTLRSLLVPDFRRVHHTYTTKLAELFSKIGAREVKSEIDEIKREIDSTVSNIVGIKNNEVTNSLEELRQVRSQRSVAKMLVAAYSSYQS